MIKLNRKTNKARNFIERYERSQEFTLRDCYINHSFEKARAEARCREKMFDMNGFGFKIMGFNSMAFTCGWLYEDKDGVLILHVETRANTYEMDY